MKPTKTVTCDVLVVGSGAGGLATALTARHHGLEVIVAEKESVFGGTTARSGGWSGSLQPAGREGGLQGFAGNRPAPISSTKPAIISMQVVSMRSSITGPRWSNSSRRIRRWNSPGPAFSDYHPDAPGGMAGGRSIVATPYDGRKLGKEITRLRPPLKEITFLGMMIGSGKELLHFFNVTRSVKSAGLRGRAAGEIRP